MKNIRVTLDFVLDPHKYKSVVALGSALKLFLTEVVEAGQIMDCFKGCKNDDQL